MKEEDKTTLIMVICAAMFIILFIGFTSWTFSIQDKNRNIICEEIALKNDYKFLFQSGGRCGNGEVCLYQCRFVNENGEVIIKNVE